MLADGVASFIDAIPQTKGYKEVVPASHLKISRARLPPASPTRRHTYV